MELVPTFHAVACPLYNILIMSTYLEVQSSYTPSHHHSSLLPTLPHNKPVPLIDKDYLLSLKKKKQLKDLKKNTSLQMLGGDLRESIALNSEVSLRMFMEK